jgi:hypothetical protein
MQILFLVVFKPLTEALWDALEKDTTRMNNFREYIMLPLFGELRPRVIANYFRSERHGHAS